METKLELEPVDFYPDKCFTVFTVTATVRLQLPNGWPLISQEHLLIQTRAGTPWFRAHGGGFVLSIAHGNGIEGTDLLQYIRSSSVWDYLDLEIRYSDNNQEMKVRSKCPISPSILPPTTPYGVFSSLNLDFQLRRRHGERSDKRHQLAREINRTFRTHKTPRNSLFTQDDIKFWVDTALYTLIGAQKQPARVGIPLADIAPVIFNPQYKEVMAQRAPLIPRLIRVLAEPSESEHFELTQETDEPDEARTRRTLAYSSIWRLMHKHAMPQGKKDSIAYSITRDIVQQPNPAVEPIIFGKPIEPERPGSGTASTLPLLKEMDVNPLPTQNMQSSESTMGKRMDPTSSRGIRGQRSRQPKDLDRLAQWRRTEKQQR
ncbi:hypothetical protein MKZ38_006402 [Zalerion maritima]|uniref:Uncharacterized protein n=1 Tax=Zalerion maritima TaxID=339359 RepID=A0AAD5RIY1_9PEZI|nr:hypothetical protein MKZ38_006402 [Zalerion maritima]